MCLVGSVLLIMMVISSEIVLFLLLLRSVKILSSVVSWRWKSLIGLGDFCGMVGYFCSLGDWLFPVGGESC